MLSFRKHMMTQQQLERGDLSSCSSPHGVDIRDFDVRVGPRMFYNNTQDLLMRRKLLEEQAEFHQALEMQSRKMANLQLLDRKNVPHPHPFSQNYNLSPAVVMSPSTNPLLSPNHICSMGGFNQEVFEENVTAPTLSLPPNALANRQMLHQGFSNVNNYNEYTTNNTNKIGKLLDAADTESIDLVLPDTLDDTIPTRSAPTRQASFSSAMFASNENAAAASSLPFASNTSTLVSSACLSNAALPKSRFLDDPSFSAAAGIRAIEM